MRAARFVSTMHAPLGILKVYEKTKPRIRHRDEMATLAMQLWRKFFVSLIELEIGKMRRLEISSAPSAFMPITMTQAQSAAISRS